MHKFSLWYRPSPPAELLLSKIAAFYSFRPQNAFTASGEPAMDRYCIKDGYTSRLNNRFFDDTPLTDEWQNEVYAKARQLANDHDLQTVLDIGTGSGFKLL